MMSLTIKYPWSVALQLKASSDKRAELKRIGRGDSKGGQFAPKDVSGIENESIRDAVVKQRKTAVARKKAYIARKRFESDPENLELKYQYKVAKRNYEVHKMGSDAAKAKLPTDVNILASGKIVPNKRNPLAVDRLNKQLGLGVEKIDASHVVRKGRLGAFEVSDKDGDVTVIIDTDRNGVYTVLFGNSSSARQESLAQAASIASRWVKTEKDAIERHRAMPIALRRPALDEFTDAGLEKMAKKLAKDLKTFPQGYERIRHQEALDHTRSVIKSRKDKAKRAKKKQMTMEEEIKLSRKINREMLRETLPRTTNTTLKEEFRWVRRRAKKNPSNYDYQDSLEEYQAEMDKRRLTL